MAMILFCFICVIFIFKGNVFGVTSNLLSDSERYVTQFTSQTFYEIVKPHNNSYHNWIIEFYLQNCGYCISYAPIFRDFAYEIREFETLKAGAIDCYLETNFNVCSDFQINKVPTLLYFSTVDSVYNGSVIHVPAIPDNIRLTTSVLDIFNSAKRPNTFILSKPPPEITARKKINTTSIISTSNNSDSLSYSQIYKDTRPHLGDMLQAVNVAFTLDIAMQRSIKGEQLTGLRQFVFALSVFFTSISSHEESNKMLQSSLADVGNALRDLDINLSGKTVIYREDWLKFIQPAIEKIIWLLPERAKTSLRRMWFSCRGSSPYLRGYPCGLWTLFHAMTVDKYTRSNITTSLDMSSYRQDRIKDPDSPLLVLLAMRQFILHFFLCSECSHNFATESANLETSVYTSQDAVLWLWRTHNQVNARLSGAPGEDPDYLKFQYPNAVIQCPACIMENTTAYDEARVLRYLVRKYSVVTLLSSVRKIVGEKEDLVKFQQHNDSVCSKIWTHVYYVRTLLYLLFDLILV